MADTENIEQEDQHEDDGDGYARIPVEDLRNLRTKAKSDKVAAELKRELAFLKAGVDTDSKAGKLLLKAYEGELTPEAIRKEAEEIGIGSKTEQSQEEPKAEDSPEPELAEDEHQSTELRQAVATNAQPASAQVDNVYDVAFADFENDLKNGATQEEALARVISKVNFYGQSTDAKYRDQVDIANH